MTSGIMLPGPVVLRDDAPLPDGWRRPALAWRDPAAVEVVSTPVAPPPPKGRWAQRCRGWAACGLPEGHAGEHERRPEEPCTCSRYDSDTRCNPCFGLVWEPATPDRAPATPDPCTCSGHGPDLACEEHRAALRAWQREYAPREYAAALEAAARELLASRDASEVVVGTRDAEALARAHARTRDALATLRAALAPEAAAPVAVERRAPVQGDPAGRRPDGTKATPKPAGTIAWPEHLAAWDVYAARYGRDQSAERIAERGGFGWYELAFLLGDEPTTWEPR